MKEELNKILLLIEEEYKDHILNESRYYLEVDIGKKAEKLGFSDLKKEYRDVNAVVPLKIPVRGMKVRIDGRTFVNYAQFDSGIAVPGYVAQKSGLPFRAYLPKDSMVLNC